MFEHWGFTGDAWRCGKVSRPSPKKGGPRHVLRDGYSRTYWSDGRGWRVQKVGAGRVSSRIQK